MPTHEAMTELVVVLKPFRAEAVLKLVAESPACAWMVREAKGYGRQKGYLDRYRGSEYSRAYLPKVEITVWVPSSVAKELADQIAAVARSGRIGDGKVFAVATAWPHVIDF